MITSVWLIFSQVISLSVTCSGEWWGLWQKMDCIMSIKLGRGIISVSRLTTSNWGASPEQGEELESSSTAGDMVENLPISLLFWSAIAEPSKFKKSAQSGLIDEKSCPEDRSGDDVISAGKQVETVVAMWLTAAGQLKAPWLNNGSCTMTWEASCKLQSYQWPGPPHPPCLSLQLGAWPGRVSPCGHGS